MRTGPTKDFFNYVIIGVMILVAIAAVGWAT